MKSKIHKYILKTNYNRNINKLVVLILLLFVSCNSSNTTASSKDKLPKEKMVEVLLDVHLAEASFTAIDRNKKDAESEMANEYALIFKKHDVKSEDFFSTYNYYIEHPALLDSVYGELVSRITTMQGQMMKQPQLNNSADTTAYRDSIKNEMLRRFKNHKKL